MLRDGNFGGRPESPTCQTSPAKPPLWHWCGEVAPAHRRAYGGLGCAERSLLLSHRSGTAAPLQSDKCVPPQWRRAQGRRLQERVETRRPSACCLWPRLRHGPAPVKAGSLPSSVVTANRESRSTTSHATAVAPSSVCVCLRYIFRPGGMHVAPCGGGVGRRLFF